VHKAGAAIFVKTISEKVAAAEYECRVNYLHNACV